MIQFIKAVLEKEISAHGISDFIKKHASPDLPDRSDQLGSLIESFISSIPDALSVIMTIAKDRRCAHAVRFAAGQIFNYLLDEEDLLPEEEFGILGLIDDAYLVHTFTALLQQRYTFVDLSKHAYKAPEKSVFALIRTLLPPGIAESLTATCNSLLQTSMALFGIHYNSEEAADKLKPLLRIDEALRSIDG